MAKEIVYDVDARERLREGADALANAVKVTLRKFRKQVLYF